MFHIRLKNASWKYSLSILSLSSTVVRASYKSARRKTNLIQAENEKGIVAQKATIVLSVLRQDVSDRHLFRCTLYFSR